MIRLLLLVLALTFLPATTLAWEIPYGVQDPMLGSAGWQNCDGSEVGNWNVIERVTPDGKRKAIYLVITSVDLPDPAYVICVVPPQSKIMVLHEGKPI